MIEIGECSIIVKNFCGIKETKANYLAYGKLVSLTTLD
jgi:hypothetical protein